MGVREAVLAAWTDGLRSPLGGVLGAMAVPYRLGVSLRNRAFDAGWRRAERVPARVVSVGNIVVGGSGKTPVTLWLANRLATAGRRPAIVARGYGRRARGVVIVGDGGRPWVSAQEGGDEAALLARRFAGPVLTAPDRIAASRVAIERFGVDTIVLDDGFQHRRIARDVDVVLVTSPVAKERMLPAGPLREPTASLARADVVLAAPGVSVPPVKCPVHEVRIEPEAVVRVVGEAWEEEPLHVLSGRAVVAAAGIARPERFLDALAALGADVVTSVLRPDHHAWSAAEVRDVCRRAGGALVVTTEKDLVKWAVSDGMAVRALRVGARVHDGDAVVRLAGGASVVCG